MSRKILLVVIFTVIVLALAIAIVLDALVGGVPRIASARDAYAQLPRPAVFTDRHGTFLDVPGTERRVLVAGAQLTADLKHAMLAPLGCLSFLDDEGRACAGRLAEAAAPALRLAYRGVEPQGFRASLWRGRVQAQLADLPAAELLEVYANTVPFGEGVFGVGLASRVYFDKEPAALTIVECALLGALSQVTALDPRAQRDDAQKAMQAVLAQLVERNLADRGLLAGAPLPELPTRAAAIAALAAPVLRLAAQRIASEHGQPALHEAGLTVKTTLDLPLQERALAALRKPIAEQRIRQGSLLVVDVANRELLAMAEEVVGGAQMTGDLIVTPRVPGSAIKPLLYLYGLTLSYTAASPIDASPVRDMELLRKLGGSDAGPWFKQLPFRLALGANLPAATIRIAEFLGPDNVLAFYRKLGLRLALDQPGLADVAGAAPVSFMDLVNGYGVLAAGGYFNTPAPYLTIEEDGRVRDLGREKPRQITDPATSYITAHMLRDEVARSALAKGEDERYFRYFHGKAGASGDGKEAYFIGFNGRYVIALQVQPLAPSDELGVPLKRVSGSEWAMPIWADFVRGLPEELRNRPLDKAFGVNCVGLDPLTGGRDDAEDPKYVSCFKLGTEPQGDAPKKASVIPALPVD